MSGVLSPSWNNPHLYCSEQTSVELLQKFKSLNNQIYFDCSLPLRSGHRQ